MNIDQAIVEAITDENIDKQSHLRQRLFDKGFNVTQPTLSRHLKRLSIVKEAGTYRRVEHAAPGVPRHTVSLAPPNLIVYHTRPGHAQLLAVLLDSNAIEGVAGTLAGDDTVFIATSEPDLEAVVGRINALLE